MTAQDIREHEAEIKRILQEALIESYRNPDQYVTVFAVDSPNGVAVSYEKEDSPETWLKNITVIKKYHLGDITKHYRYSADISQEEFINYLVKTANTAHDGYQVNAAYKDFLTAFTRNLLKKQI